jgi:lipopolysaccharide biosynthesis regulator YciM
MNPEHPNALLEYGNLQRSLGKLVAAFDLHRKALHTSGSELSTLESLADDFLSAGRPDALQALWDRARRAGRGEEIPLERLRDHYVSKKEWKAAVNIQETLLQIPGYSRKDEGRRFLASFLYEAGSQAIGAGQTEEGIHLLQNAIRNKGDFVPAHVALGDAFRQAGDAKKALGEWRAGYERAPALVFLNRMISMMNNGVSDKDVVQTLRKTSRKHPSDDRIRLALAEAHLHAGRASDALEELTKLSATVRGTLPARTLGARAYLELSNVDGARSELSPPSGNEESVLGDFREKPGFRCSACEEVLESWTARCPACGRWETVDTY